MSFKEIFEDYGGDYSTTMARFVNNESMYQRFLGMLFKDENLEKLGSSIEKHDLKGGFEAAHTLKGVVGNMGLTPLFDAVCEILEPLRNGEERFDYPEMYQKIRQEFERAGQLRERLEKGE